MQLLLKNDSGTVVFICISIREQLKTIIIQQLYMSEHIIETYTDNVNIPYRYMYTAHTTIEESEPQNVPKI